MPITLDLRGAPEAKAMLEQFAGRELVNRMRRAVRAGGNEFKKGVEDAARSEPTGNVPESFQKVRVRISASMRRGGIPTAIVRPKSPLFNIFEPGAGEHDMPPGAGAAGEHFRSRAFVSRRGVRHPGMKARPILPTAFDDKLHPAEDAVARVLFENVR